MNQRTGKMGRYAMIRKLNKIDININMERENENIMIKKYKTPHEYKEKVYVLIRALQSKKKR